MWKKGVIWLLVIIEFWLISATRPLECSSSQRLNVNEASIGAGTMRQAVLGSDNLSLIILISLELSLLTFLVVIGSRLSSSSPALTL